MRALLLGIVLASTLASTPAWACRIPNPELTVFNERPAEVPDGYRLHRGRFTNQGPEADAFRGQAPWTAEDGDFIGVLFERGREPTPVYGWVTSCNGLFGNGGFDVEAYIVTRPLPPDRWVRGLEAATFHVRSGTWNVGYARRID